MTQPEHPEVENIGPVACITLPPGWIEREVPRRGEYDIATLKKFTPPDREDVQICFHYRGLPVTADSAANFRKTLSGEPKSLTASEWWQVQEVLNRMALSQEFAMASVRTENLNGRKVLIAEGRWKESAMDMYSLFIDAEGDGSIIQEIYYAAPKGDYYHFLPAAKACMQTVEWKPLTATAGAAAYEW